MSTAAYARGTLRRARCGVLFSLILTTIAPAPVFAQAHISLPPVNLGGTSFMDGVGGPGILVREALGAFGAPHFSDASGATVPGENKLAVFTSTTLVAYMPPFKVLGGNWGCEVLVPVVHARLTAPSGSASTTGIGDVTFSALVWQAPTLVLGWGQFFQRLDFDIVAPTGQYASNLPITAGSHLWSLNPYYAFTWLATDRIETSWRVHYLWNSTNNAPAPAYGATSIRPGQAIHVNGAASIAVIPGFNAGVAGYFLRQISNSQANGHSVSGSQEQVAALGLGFMARVGALQFIANAYAEFAVENRPQGLRADVVVQDVW